MEFGADRVERAPNRTISR